MQIAKSAWLEAAAETAKPILSPQYRPVIYQTASQFFCLWGNR